MANHCVIMNARGLKKLCENRADKYWIMKNIFEDLYKYIGKIRSSVKGLKRFRLNPARILEGVGEFVFFGFLT